MSTEQAPAKRGRGRPRKADALTPAERARRYRERKRAAAAQASSASGAWPWKHLTQHPSRQPAAPQVRYKGPNGETWTGRGKQPAWVAHAYRLGWSLDDLEQLAGWPHAAE